MRHSGILHPQLAHVVARLGHGQTICVADAGLPVPAGVERIALGYAPGRAPMLDVLEAVLHDLVVESAVVARELDAESPLGVALRSQLARTGAQVEVVDHEKFKQMTRTCLAVVQTGEFTPYANVILSAGVPF